MQKQFKATLKTNCLLEKLLKTNNQTIQPAILSKYPRQISKYLPQFAT